MTETYQSIGQGASLAIALLGVLIIAWHLIAYAITKRKGRAFGKMIVLGIWYVLGGLLAVPNLILFAVTFVIALSTAFTQKEPRVSLAGRIGSLIMIVVLISGMCFFFPSQKVILTDNTITAAATGAIGGSKYDDGTLQRDGLQIDAKIFADLKWMTLKRWYNWSVEHGEDLPSLNVSGNDYYWGPHGLVTGDQLGRRIAEWSGATPKYGVHYRS